MAHNSENYSTLYSVMHLASQNYYKISKKKLILDFNMTGHASSEVTLRAHINAMPGLKIFASIKNGFKVYCNVCTISADMKRSNHIREHNEPKSTLKQSLLGTSKNHKQAILKQTCTIGENFRKIN